jgi:Holliday junction resolvase RusA-like endonuclease
VIKITVLGEPTGKGRPKFSTFNGHAVAYTPSKTVNYENLVKLSYQQQCNDKPYPKEISLRAEIRAYFAVPKSVSKTKRDMMLKGQINPTKKPDTDNIAKAILDALNGIAYYDDSQIVDLTVYKRYSDSPRAEVCISTL